MLRSLILACLLLVACSTTKPPETPPLGPVVVWSIANPWRWNEAGLQLIREGVDEWNIVCGREILREGHGGVVIHQRFSPDDMLEFPGGVVLGMYDPDTYTIELYAPAGSRADVLRATVAHEMGHALGLLHSEPGSGSIMAPYIGDQSGVVTEVDIRALGPAWGCSTSTP